MKSLFTSLLVICSFYLSGCDPVDGNLILKEDLNVNKEPNESCQNDSLGCLNQELGSTIPAGGYDMKIESSSERMIQLIISKNLTLVKLELNLPKGKQFPQNGELLLKANESGQPFDFLLGSKVEMRNSENYSGNESCTETVLTQVCFIVSGSNGNQPREKCEMRNVLAKGEQHVEYYYHTVDQYVSAQFLKSGTQEVTGNYSGSRSSSNKIYTRKDRCELYRPYLFVN